MSGIVLIGGGGHCASVLDSLKALNLYDKIEIADVKDNLGGFVSDIRISHTDEELAYLFDTGIKNAFITVGSIKDTSIRRQLYLYAKNIGFSFPKIIDKTAAVANDSVIGAGVFIGKNAVVNSSAVINKFAIINTSAVIEHDCVVGEFSHVAVGGILCGNVKLGEDTFIGANATVIQNINIDSNCVIGAGCVVRHDVKKVENF